jgi:hypothetical protein
MGIYPSDVCWGARSISRPLIVRMSPAGYSLAPLSSGRLPFTDRTDDAPVLPLPSREISVLPLQPAPRVVPMALPYLADFGAFSRCR